MRDVYLVKKFQIVSLQTSLGTFGKLSGNKTALCQSQIWIENAIFACFDDFHNLVADFKEFPVTFCRDINHEWNKKTATKSDEPTNCYTLRLC